MRYETTEVTQSVYGGTDPGRTNIGEAVVNRKGEVIYKAHVSTRNKDVPKRMEEKKQHRQASRRGERLRRKRRAKQNGTTKTFPEGRLISGCKEPVMLKDIINTESRFANRKRPENWICPTVRHLVQTHINAVNKICSILPVTDWTLEYNKFAFMKLENGEIRGIDYQKGRLKGFKSKEEYIHNLQKGKCTCCGKPIEHYHHIISRSKGGADTPENHIGLCKGCHKNVHSGAIDLKEIGLKKKYAALSVLNQAIPFIAEELIHIFGEDHVHFCTGYETKALRKCLGTRKDHPEDAVCIAAIGADIPNVTDGIGAYEIKQFRRHDRSITKAQKERTYYLDGKAVCKNRHKRTDQRDDSLEEFAKKNLPDVGMLTVRKSTRSYNHMERNLPGTEVIYNGKRYITRGNHNTRYMLYGLDGAGVPGSKCKIIQRNTGLVYM